MHIYTFSIIRQAKFICLVSNIFTEAAVEFLQAVIVTEFFTVSVILILAEGRYQVSIPFRVEEMEI